MCLPEGALRQTLTTMFSKALPLFDDFELFRIVGKSTIGRLRCVENAADSNLPSENVRALLRSRNTAELFTHFLQKYATVSGVAGVQPKVLVRDDGSLAAGRISDPSKADRLTFRGSTHLLKSFDPVEFPGMGLNEWLCLRAARAAGLETANAELSEDGRVLVIERFDVNSDGGYLGFEDGCALAGMIARDKYVGSYEQLARTLSLFLTPSGTQEMAIFFRSIVLSMVVRNGDAHRKNFAVVYADAESTVRLSPVFDVITSTAYIKEDTPALLLDGSKRWPDNKRLQKFARTRCDLSPNEAQTIMAEVADGVATTLKELSSGETLDRDPSAKDTLDRMKLAWEDGLKAIRAS
jgi:serine/threonine-protein kinase HipA